MLKIKDATLFNKFKDFFEIYLPNIKSRSEKTIIAYRIAINLFNDYIINKYKKSLHTITINDYTADNIIGFRSWLQNERKNNNTTLNLRISALHSFCKYLMKNRAEYLPELSKILEIEKIKVIKNNDFKYLTLEQLTILFKQPNESTPIGLRDKFFLELLYDSGCRDQEILNLCIKDLIIDNDCFSIKIIGKGNKYRVTPISSKVLFLYYKYQKIFLQNCSPNDLLFFTIRNGIKCKMSDDNVARFMNKYENVIKQKYPDFPHLHPHLLRHSRAMNLYIYGMPLPMISEWLGHTQIETTSIYAQATTEMKREIADKIDKSSPKIFKDEIFNYENNDEVIKKLYGLQ